MAVRAPAAAGRDESGVLTAGHDRYLAVDAALFGVPLE